MIHIYFYLLKKSNMIQSLKDGLATFEHTAIAIHEIDETSGYFMVDEKKHVMFQQFLNAFVQDMFQEILVMKAYSDNAFTRYLLSVAPRYGFHGTFYDCDVLWKLILKKDDTGIALLKHEMEKLGTEDIETIKGFLHCDMNVIKASEYIYVHRNTFNYRLKKIYDKTGLDIRLFHNCMICYLWLNLYLA